MKKFLMSVAVFAFFGIGAAAAQGCPHAAKAAEANKPACTQTATATAVAGEGTAKTGCQAGAAKGCCANKAGASTATAAEGSAKTCAQKAAAGCCANKAGASASTNPNNAPAAKPATVKAVKAQASPAAAPKAVANE